MTADSGIVKAAPFLPLLLLWLLPAFNTQLGLGVDAGAGSSQSLPQLLASLKMSR